MTFYEAAVEVLRRAGRPLHYKKIAEIAVREKLLSHVGKSPHDTMSTRLEREAKKNSESVLDQVRPGVYKLDKEHAKDLTEKVKKRQEQERKRRQARKKKQQQKQRNQQNSQQQQKSQQQQQKKSRDNKKDDSSAQKDTSGDDQQRRRRRSRGSQTQHTKKRKQDRDQKDESQKQKKQKGQDDQTKRRRRRPSKKSGDAAEPSGEAGLEVSSTTHLDEGPVELKGIAKAAYTVLDGGDREAMHIEELADAIFDRKLVKFHTHDAVTTVQSAIANDNQVRKQQGHRPLFGHDEDGYWWLTEWELTESVHQNEQAILSLSEQIRQASIDQLGEALRDVKTEALEHLALTLLERLGYHNIKVSKRSSDGDVFFTADWRQGLADVRVCVRVVSDHNRDLGSDAVEDLRETLDHYSASEGVIIHLGNIDDDAVRESRRDGQEPITLLDDTTFVELLVKHGIGVQTYECPIVTVDTDFIDALKS